MKKVDFFRMMGVFDRIESHIYDHWSDYRIERGLPYNIIDLDFRFDLDFRDETVYIIVKTPYGTDEFLASDMYEDVKRADEPQMLWHCNYWDGPTNGLARYKDQLCWFECVEWESDNLFNMRVYNLHELTQEQIADEIHRHNMFRRNVGRHCDYTDEFLDDTITSKTKTNLSVKSFYRWTTRFFKQRRNYTAGKVLGQFDASQFWKKHDRIHKFVVNNC